AARLRRHALANPELVVPGVAFLVSLAAVDLATGLEAQPADVEEQRGSPVGPTGLDTSADRYVAAVDAHIAAAAVSFAVVREGAPAGVDAAVDGDRTSFRCLERDDGGVCGCRGDPRSPADRDRASGSEGNSVKRCTEKALSPGGKEAGERRVLAALEVPVA